jgi:hypothetical protein
VHARVTIVVQLCVPSQHYIKPFSIFFLKSRVCGVLRVSIGLATGLIPHVEVVTEITEMQSKAVGCVFNKTSFTQILRLPNFALRMSIFIGHGTMTDKLVNAECD